MLADSYFTARYGAPAAPWRALLIFLPMRVVEAIRLSAQNAIRRVKSWLSWKIEYRYDELLIREASADRGLNSVISRQLSAISNGSVDALRLKIEPETQN
jgi:hypothetical protein